jgi:hypothetical protein
MDKQEQIQKLTKKLEEINKSNLDPKQKFLQKIRLQRIIKKVEGD